MTWKQLTERDRREWKQQASCLDGDPLLWIWPLYLHVNQKSDDDDEGEKAKPAKTKV